MNEPSDGEQLLRLTNGRARIDGKTIAFRIERQDRKYLDLWCPVEEIGSIIEFLCEAANLASEQSGSPSPHPSHQAYAVPLQPLGIGFLVGADRETSLVVQLPGVALAFRMNGSELALMADDLRRNAMTLSADHQKPQ